MSDLIKTPPHYLEGRKYAPREIILDWGLSYCLGNVVKYVSRAGRKGKALEDLEKAKDYLEREIERLRALEKGNSGEERTLRAHNLIILKILDKEERR